MDRHRAVAEVIMVEQRNEESRQGGIIYGQIQTFVPHRGTSQLPETPALGQLTYLTFQA